MAYKVLYRKYRPQDFNNLYGQDNIKKLLIDSIINDKLSHAYLFSGPRGTGKTSTAKLFAKTINCENSNNGIPCGNCQSCLNYEQSADIIEIDAASNNGVDEIRDLRDNAKILPTYSKYKIYIIDEVHMLSQSAWNAFLKILEEPPKHVIFILATTEIQKIPITILSRCQRFNFQRISNDIIKENILRISNEENIKINDEAADYLAMLADGGMRDALSLLDQLSKENEEITKDLIQQTFGILTENDVEEIFDYISKNDIISIENIFNEYSKKGLDVNLLISKIINYLYKLEINIINGNKSNFTIEELKQIAKELIICYNKPDALILIKIILLSFISQSNEIISQNISQGNMGISQDNEIISQNISQNNKIISQEKNISREIISTEKTIEKKEVEKQQKKLQPENKNDIAKNEFIDKLKKIRLNNSFVNASKAEKEKFKKSWEIFINKEVLKNNVEILSLIEDVNVEVVSPTNVMFSHKSPSTAILFNQSLNNLEQEFNNSENYKIKFICLTSEEWEKEKQEFISNKNKKYEYIEEPNTEKESELLTTAMDIFDENIIEIN